MYKRLNFLCDIELERTSCSTKIFPFFTFLLQMKCARVCRVNHLFKRNTMYMYSKRKCSIPDLEFWDNYHLNLGYVRLFFGNWNAIIVDIFPHCCLLSTSVRFLLKMEYLYKATLAQDNTSVLIFISIYQHCFKNIAYSHYK